MTRRRTVVTFGAAAVAVGAVLGGALLMQGPSKISLSGYSHNGDGASTSGYYSYRSHMYSSGGYSYLSPNFLASSWSWTNQRSMGWMTTSTSAPYTTLDNQADPTFNQLLGINNSGLIAGYYGSGNQGHPNRGYLLQGSSRTYQDENYPGAVQTQVTGLNDRGVTVGFYSTMNTANNMNNNFGFYSWGGRYYPVSFPTFHNASPPVNQLLGINNSGWATGFYTNTAGNNFGYLYNIWSRRFIRVVVPRWWWHGNHGVSLTASAINNRGDVAGFYTPANGATYGFLRLWNGQYYRLAYPGASMTQIFGVNDRDEVVGSYTMGSGNSAKTYGFTWTPGYGWTSITAPQGQGATTINGVNDAGNLVGFYTDSAGNTHGLLILVVVIRGHHFHYTWTTPSATPSVTPTMSPSMGATPSMTATPAAVPATTAKPAAQQASPAPTNAGNHW